MKVKYKMIDKMNSRKLFVFEGTQEEFEQIQTFFELGKLSELLGVRVLDVGIVPESQPITASQVRLNLSQWLEGIVEPGWQTVKDLFSTQADNPAFSVRSARQLREIEADNPVTGVKRGKLIDLGIQQVGNPVALIVTLTPATDEEINIHLRIYPTGRQFYLPRNLQLTVLDATGATCPELQTQVKKTDNFLQLNLTGKPGEQFSLKVTLGDISITENFVI